MCYVHNQWYYISCATLYVAVSTVKLFFVAMGIQQ